MNRYLSAILLIFLSASLSLSGQMQTLPAGEDLYLGTLRFSPDLSARNTFYWSVGTEVCGKGSVLPARQVYSTGAAQADFRICTYEDGSPIYEDGKYFFCVSSRTAALGQTVYSFDLNTCRMTLVGTLMGYAADGSVQSLIAPHIIFNRQDGFWYVFAHWGNPHQICVGRCFRDPRWGNNDVTCRPLVYDDVIQGDEDNFVFYDSDHSKWVLIYSRKSTWIARQESDSIDGEYTNLKRRDDIRSLTGVNAVKIGGRRYIVTGFGKAPDIDGYKVFDCETLEDVCDLHLDIPTGGFRGWGTILDITEGESTKYQLLTFDRINPTGVSNWEYGNTYLYEAIERNPGTEYDIVRYGVPTIKANVEERHTPSDLHFVRRFAQRLNYSQEIPLSILDLRGNIFQQRGNPYPVKNLSGSVSYGQNGERIDVRGKGSFSVLAGSHQPRCEYVVDLSGMSRGEVRYLALGTLDEDLVTVRFSREKGSIIISLEGETLTVDGGIDNIRILVSRGVMGFVNAD